MTFALIAIAVSGLLAAIGGVAYVFRARVLDLLTSRKGYRLKRDVPYAALPRQKFDLYVPDKGADTAPLIVFFYGSDWTHGSKDVYRFLGQPFASRGYLVAVPDYRMFPDAVFPQFVEDGALAVAHLWRTMRLPDGGPRRLILIGHSAGGHTAALLTMDRRYLASAGLPQGAIDRMIGISGPYDFAIDQPKYQPIFPMATRPDTQPIRFVDGMEPPILLIVGDPDIKLDPGNTTRLAKKIEEKGGSVVLRVYPGVNHVATITAIAESLPGRRPPILEEILAFVGADPGVRGRAGS